MKEEWKGHRSVIPLLQFVLTQREKLSCLTICDRGLDWSTISDLSPSLRATTITQLVKLDLTVYDENLAREVVEGESDGESDDEMDQRRGEPLGKMLLPFLSRLPRLESLSLYFDRLTCLGVPVKYIFEAGLKWPSLQHLTLCWVRGSFDELWSILEVHNTTLRSVHLSSIYLEDDSWERFLLYMRDDLQLREVEFSGWLNSTSWSEEEEGVDTWQIDDDLGGELSGYVMSKEGFEFPLHDGNKS